MATFADTTGHVWTIALDIATASRVRGMLDVDLLDTEQVMHLFSDPIRLVDVLYVIAKPQADAAGVSSEDFGSRLNCDQLEAGAKALEVALVDFFPSRKRAALEMLFRKHRQYTERAASRVEEILTSEQLDRVLDEKLAQALGSWYIEPPAK